MYVETIVETRVRDRVYSVSQTKEGDRTEWTVEVVADPGSYRASETHNTIIGRIGFTSREQCVRVFNLVVETALDSVATPFD